MCISMIEQVWAKLDPSGKGSVSKRELLSTLRSNPMVATFLNLPQHFHESTATGSGNIAQALEAFRSMSGETGKITFAELQTFVTEETEQGGVDNGTATAAAISGVSPSAVMVMRKEGASPSDLSEQSPALRMRPEQFVHTEIESFVTSLLGRSTQLNSALAAFTELANLLKADGLGPNREGLSCAEFTQRLCAYTSTYAPQHVLSDSTTSAIFRAIDVDQNDVLSLSELQCGLTSFFPLAVNEAASVVFDACDAPTSGGRGNGLLEPNEFAIAFRSIFALSILLKKHESISTCFAHVDASEVASSQAVAMCKAIEKEANAGDVRGGITKEEFTAWFVESHATRPARTRAQRQQQQPQQILLHEGVRSPTLASPREEARVSGSPQASVHVNRHGSISVMREVAASGPSSNAAANIPLPLTPQLTPMESRDSLCRTVSSAASSAQAAAAVRNEFLMRSADASPLRTLMRSAPEIARQLRAKEGEAGLMRAELRMAHEREIAELRAQLSDATATGAGGEPVTMELRTTPQLLYDRKSELMAIERAAWVRHTRAVEVETALHATRIADAARVCTRRAPTSEVRCLRLHCDALSSVFSNPPPPPPPPPLTLPPLVIVHFSVQISRLRRELEQRCAMERARIVAENEEKLRVASARVDAQLRTHDAQLEAWYTENTAMLERSAEESQRRYAEIFEQTLDTLRSPVVGVRSPTLASPREEGRMSGSPQASVRVNRHGSISVMRVVSVRD